MQNNVYLHATLHTNPTLPQLLTNFARHQGTWYQATMATIGPTPVGLRVDGVPDALKDTNLDLSIFDCVNRYGDHREFKRGALVRGDYVRAVMVVL